MVRALDDGVTTGGAEQRLDLALVKPNALVLAAIVELDTLELGEMPETEKWPIHRPAPEFVEQEAVSEVFPKAVVQLEDFATHAIDRFLVIDVVQYIRNPAGQQARFVDAETARRDRGRAGPWCGATC